MAVTAQESYYESLGRQSGLPYADPKLDYIETEPDMTKPVNENIDKEIKDTRQFFQDNINIFNETQKARSNRMKDLLSLTKSGAKLIAEIDLAKENRDYLERLEKAVEKRDTEYTLAGVNYQALENRNLAELNKELGKADAAIKKDGVYITDDGEGNEIAIYAPGVEDFRKLIASIPVQNGRGTANDAVLYFPEFVKAAKESLVFKDTGLLFGDLDYDQKAEWTKEMLGMYIGMWRLKDPNLSDRLIIKKLLPTLKSQEKLLMGSELNNLTTASQDVTGTANQLNAVKELKTFSNVLQEWKEGDDPVRLGDTIFGENGLVERRTQYHIGQGLEPTAARSKALDELVGYINFGVNNDMLNEMDIDFLLTEYKYLTPAGLKSFSDHHDVRFQEIETNYNNKIADNRKIVLQGRYKGYLNNWTDNRVPMTREQLDQFIGTDMYENAEKLYLQSNKGTLINEKFLDEKETLNEAIGIRAGDNKLFSNVDGLNPEAAIASNGDFLRSGANRYFLREYNEQLQLLKDEDKAQAVALQKTLEALENGKFDKHVDGNYLKKPENLKEVYITNRNLIEKSKESAQKWLTNSEVNLGEEPYALEAQNWMKNGGPIPAYYRELAKLFPEIDAEKLMYDRLVALKRISPNEYPQYKSKLKGDLNILDTKKLVNNPWYSKTFQVAVNNADGFNTVLTDLHVEGADYGTFKNSAGVYDKEVDLTSIPLVIGEGVEGNSLYTLINENPDGEFGIYGIKGRQLSEVINYMLEKGVIDPTQTFDEGFQKKVLLTRAKLENHKYQSLNGDVSYLGLFEISDENRELYKKVIGITGQEGVTEEDDTPKALNFNEIDMLIPYLIKVKLNEEL